MFSGDAGGNLHTDRQAGFRGRRAGGRCLLRLRVLALPPGPRGGATHRQSVLLLLSHHPHHLQSHVPLVRRNLGPNSLLSPHSWFWVQGRYPETPLPGGVRAPQQQPRRTLHPSAPLTGGSLLWNEPCAGQKLVRLQGSEEVSI